jgi:hypothetical protein
LRRHSGPPLPLDAVCPIEPDESLKLAAAKLGAHLTQRATKCGGDKEGDAMKWGGSDQKKLDEITEAINKGESDQRIPKARADLLRRELDSIEQDLDARRITKAKERLSSLAKYMKRENFK